MNKTSLFLVFLALISQNVFSQDLRLNPVKWANLSDVRQFDISFNSKNAKGSLITQMGIPTDYEFRDKIIEGVYGAVFPTRIVDELGYTHERYSQYYKGTRVEHSDIRTHYFDGKLVAVNGTYSDIPNIDVSVVLTKESAIQKAKDIICNVFLKNFRLI